MAATTLMRVIHDCICSGFLQGGGGQTDVQSTLVTQTKCGRGFLRRLEQEHPPVRRPQVEHVGPLAVVGGSHGQSVVDGHGVLHILLRQLALCTVLILSANHRAPSNQSPDMLTPLTPSQHALFSGRRACCLIRPTHQHFYGHNVVAVSSHNALCFYEPTVFVTCSGRPPFSLLTENFVFCLQFRVFLCVFCVTNSGAAGKCSLPSAGREPDPSAWRRKTSTPSYPVELGGTKHHGTLSTTRTGGGSRRHDNNFTRTKKKQGALLFPSGSAWALRTRKPLL